MRARTALLVTLVAAGSVAGVADAAPKAACNLVADAKGDTFAGRQQDTANELGVPAPYGPQEDSLDIIGGDIASDGKVVTAVLRVVKLSKSAATAPNGLSFRFQFSTPATDGDTSLWLDARTEGATEIFAAGTRAITANVSTKTADAKGVFDVAKSEIRITAPVAAWATAAKIAKGTKLLLTQSDGGSLDQSGSRYVTTNPVTGAAVATFADVAISDKFYTVGAKSCVKPGK